MNNEIDMNVLKNNNLPCSIEDQIAQLVGYENENCREQTAFINRNQSVSGDTEKVEEKLRVKHSSDTIEHIENLMKIEYVSDKEEANEIVHENHVDHEEVEDYEEEDVYTQILENENQLENTCRSVIDSEEEIYLDLKEGSQNLDNSSAQNSSDSSIHNKKQIFNPDDGFQYDTKHLLDVKKIKVLHECSICQYTTTHMGILRKHISTIHNSKTTWKCKHCCKKFGSKALLLKHVQKEHSKRPRKCPFCMCIILCNGKAMKNHIKNTHPSECLSRVCGDKNKPELKGLTRNGSRGMYKCNNCSYSNRCLGIMLSHIKMHSMKYVLKCLYCHYMINQRKLYRIHLSSAHKLAKKIYICSRCFFQSEDQEEYAEHFYEPHMYHNCPSCDFKTYYIETFYLHSEIHENSKHNSENSLQNLTQQNQHDEIIVGDKYSQEDTHAYDVSDLMTISFKIEGSNLEDKKNNIEFKNIDCLDAENRGEIKTVLREYYTQRDVNGVMMFSCLKCDFISNFSSNYEICEHLMNIHSICSKNREIRFLKKGENEVEFVQVEGEPHPANRYVIEPTVTNLQTQSCNKKTSSFACEQCDFTAPTLDRKIFHEQKTHNATHFKCPTCSFEANDRSVFIDHFKNHMDLNQQVISCPFCELEIDNEISLKHHVDTEHLYIMEECVQEGMLKDDENIITPASVDDVFDRSRIETTFSTTENKFGEIYQCDLCSYNAPDLITLESHHKFDHITESLECPRCLQSQFSNVREFSDHLNQHCPQCHFQSSDPKKVRLHVLTHVPKYKKYNVGVKTSRLNHCINSNMVPEQEDNISDGFRECSISEISDLDLNGLDDDELEKQNIFGEEIRIIFEDSLNEDDGSLEMANCENDQMRIAIDDSIERELEKNYFPITNNTNEDSFDSSKKVSKRKQQEEESHRSKVNSSECKSITVKKFTLESDKKLMDKPVRIIKVPEFQCFDCLNIYKTRYTLVDHRKRLHGLKKPHSCTYCMEIFETYSYLKSHYYRIHKVSFHYKGPIFKCPLCEYNSIHLKQTQKHIMKTHQRSVAGFQKRGAVY